MTLPCSATWETTTEGEHDVIRKVAAAGWSQQRIQQRAWQCGLQEHDTYVPGSGMVTQTVQSDTVTSIGR
jgi:hypothetical protein